MQNPYATHIGGADPEAVISRTAVQVRQLADAIGPDRIDRAPAPGKWSPREILAHLADCELAFAFRLRQGLAEDHHVIQPFDQERWANAYPAYDAETAIATFSAVRAWNLLFVRSLPEAARLRRITHPERGEMTLQTVVETMAGHDVNHLKQLDAIANAR